MYDLECSWCDLNYFNFSLELNSRNSFVQHDHKYILSLFSFYFLIYVIHSSYLKY
jgi:hypothetical protein